MILFQARMKRGVFRLKSPGNKGNKAAGFVLKLPKSLQVSDALREAIESYQRSVGRTVDGKATRELADHMATQDKVGAMLQRLEAVREESETHKRLKCQLNLLMVASRGGWNVAQVVLNEGLLESCELEVVSESD